MKTTAPGVERTQDRYERIMYPIGSSQCDTATALLTYDELCGLVWRAHGATKNVHSRGKAEIRLLATRFIVQVYLFESEYC